MMQRLPACFASAAIDCEWNSAPQFATAMPLVVATKPFSRLRRLT